MLNPCPLVAFAIGSIVAFVTVIRKTLYTQVYLAIMHSRQISSDWSPHLFDQPAIPKTGY
jgi:hypothetical protein